VSTKVESDRLASELAKRGYDAEALNGDLNQESRERVLGKFRDHRLSILVATDVAARGIDIEKITHVINWSLPHDPEAYVHRIGRTGRAGNSGTAITFVTPEEYRKLFRIRKYSGTNLKKGQIPGVAGILSAKKDKLAAKVISKMVERAETELVDDIWREMADKVLEGSNPREALAAALAEGFGSQIDPKRYRDITDVSVDVTATSRLFVAVGKRDRITPRALVTMIKKLSNLPDRLIDSIEIYDNFSFVTVPYRMAEKIIDEARRSGGFPVVKKAVPKDKNAAPASREPRSRKPQDSYGNPRKNRP
jgi:ATP-dependent RNA helicase DeaD